MPKITFLPHKQCCPDGAVVTAKLGETILDVALRYGISMQHACEKSCACATCHCIIRSGFQSLNAITELEEDMLDKAWGLTAQSRLGCQAKIADSDLVVEIPLYSINYVGEES